MDWISSSSLNWTPKIEEDLRIQKIEEQAEKLWIAEEQAAVERELKIVSVTMKLDKPRFLICF